MSSLQEKLKHVVRSIEKDMDIATSYDTQLRHCSASVQAKQLGQAHKIEQDRSTTRELMQKSKEYDAQARKSCKRINDTGVTKEVRLFALVMRAYLESGKTFPNSTSAW